MGFKIATNAASINTQKWLGVSNTGLNKSLERLSSGFKVNSAKDDAAGSAIALKLNVKASSVSKAIDNGNQALGMLQTAEGGLNTISDILNRLKTLAVQAASDTVSSSDRASIDAEATKLEGQVTNIINNTKYGDTSVLGTTSTAFTFQLGDAKANNQIEYASTALTVYDGSMTTRDGAETYMLNMDAAITTINTAKAELGATMNKISFQVDNLTSIYENTMSAVSTIKDADFAAEMANFTKFQILNQSGIAMLSQANQLPQQVLSLLQG